MKYTVSALTRIDASSLERPIKRRVSRDSSHSRRVWEELVMLSPQTDAERFRKEAEDCRELAGKAMSPADKEAWLQLAEDWLKLAQEAEKGRFGRTG
jgi:hypothetical protein